MINTHGAPLIFLDIHGVLLLKNGDEPRGAGQVLGALVQATNALIVITSSLRMGRSVDDLCILISLLAGRYVGSRVIDKTDDDDDRTRGELIAAWMEENLHAGPYVILDDDCTIAPHDHAVCINGAIGLTSADAKKAMRILGGAE